MIYMTIFMYLTHIRYGVTGCQRASLTRLARANVVATARMRCELGQPLCLTQKGISMRRSKQETQRTHARIVEAAARQFRAAGIKGTGIDDLMRQAGLTHGGFYSHFRQKEALIAEACVAGFAQTQQKLANAVRTAPPGRQVEAILDGYLSTDQRDHPEAGCVMPTLAAEIARSSPQVRAAFTQIIQEFLDYLASFLPATADSHPTDDALVLLAGMVGTMLLARAIDDAELSERLLRVNRAFYAQAFSHLPLSGEDRTA
jgi:TetR/AcrR family transcriptional repressor of nem operon